MAQSEWRLETKILPSSPVSFTPRSMFFAQDL